MSGCGSFARWYDPEYWFGEVENLSAAAYPELADLPVPVPSDGDFEDAATIAARLAAERQDSKQP